MKKLVVSLSLFLSLSMPLSLFSLTRQEEEEARFYQEGKMGRSQKRDILIGTAAGTGLGVAAGEKLKNTLRDDRKSIQALGGSLQQFDGTTMTIDAEKKEDYAMQATGIISGATLGLYAPLIKHYGLRLWQLHKMNRILSFYLNTSLKDLSPEQAALIIAAYRQNTRGLQRLIHENESFVIKNGVWESLATLFYNKPATPETINALKMLLKTN